MTTDTNPGHELAALRETQDAAGWLLTIAEASNHPDAAAAARWLDDIGSRCFEDRTAAALLCAAIHNQRGLQ